jgi:uncharacterized membrane protein
VFLEINPISPILTSMALLLCFIILFCVFYKRRSSDYFFEANFIFLLLLSNLTRRLDIADYDPNYAFFVIMTIFVVFIAYFMGYLVKAKFFQSKFESRSLVNFYNYSGAILLLLLISNQLSGALISLFWGLLALVILVFGFLFKDKDLRLQSFGVFGLVIFKVFIIDVSELEIVYRIFSYLILGLILLSISFVYNKNKDKIKDLF